MVNTKHSLQASGNERAEANDYSGAIKLWNRALLLTPDRAVLHEMKAQVFIPSSLLTILCRSARRLLLEDTSLVPEVGLACHILSWYTVMTPLCMFGSDSFGGRADLGSGAECKQGSEGSSWITHKLLHLFWLLCYSRSGCLKNTFVSWVHVPQLRFCAARSSIDGDGKGPGSASKKKD